AVIFYFLFSFVIKKWNLRTPGREEEVEVAAGEPDPALLEAELALAAEGDSRTDAPLVAELENKLDKELEGR
ncbi:MAG: PTS N-acetylglucosamine transporter subunit IIBC, partial [Rhodococcus sp. (in: high G+C Gram-positive bacteria)]